MPTLEQLISNTQNAPDKGIATRAKSFTKRQIAAWIHSTRAFLVTKSVEKEDSIPVAYQQDLGCWPLESVDAADCECPWVWDETVKKLVIPEVLEINDNKGIAFFGLIDKRTRIYLPSVIYGSLDDYVRFKCNKTIQAQMIGTQTIYIRGEKARRLKVVNVRGIFKDPTLVSFYNQQGEQFCYDANKTPYPIPGDMENIMYSMIWQQYILPFANAPRDNTNQENNKALV